MRPRNYAHILELVRERPWAVLPSTLATIRDIVRLHVRGETLSESEIQERLAVAQAQAGERAGEQRGAGVAVIPLYGVIVPKANLMTEMSGATSVQGFMRMFRNALSDSEVKAIIIDTDSPGGLTDLIPEAAAEIRAARGQKPIVAVANTIMASAAYWLACQADEVVASPSAWLGSIGVYTEHDDLSAWYAEMGVNHTYISAGKFKVEGNEYEPLTEEATRHVQELVDDAYGMFTSDVAKARGVSPEKVRNGFGQGRILTAKMSLAEGLADRIDTLDATVKRMVWVAARQKPAEAYRALGDRTSLEAQMFAADMGELATGRSFDEIAAVGTAVAEQFAVTGDKTMEATEHILQRFGVDDVDPDYEFEREKYARRLPA